MRTSGFNRGEPAQVALHAVRSLSALLQKPRNDEAGFFARAGIPENKRLDRRKERNGLWRSTRAPISCAEILVRDPLFRTRRYDRAAARALPAGSPVRVMGRRVREL